MTASTRTTRSRLARFALPAVAGLLAHGAAAPASAAPGPNAGDGLFANLSGANEVPGPADPNGAGAAIVNMYPRGERVCAKISVTKIGTPIAAHIHRGGPKVAGPIVVNLTSAVTGGALCTGAVPTSLVREILAHPAGFYVNVHTAQYPAGAIRGQLHG